MLCDFLFMLLVHFLITWSILLSPVVFGEPQALIQYWKLDCIKQ